MDPYTYINPSFDALSVVLLFGVFNGWVIMAYIYHKKNKGWKNLLLFLTISSLTQMEAVLYFSGYMLYTLHLFYISTPFILLMGPVLLSYIFKMNDRPFDKKQWLKHGSAFGLFFLYCILLYVQPSGKKLENYIYFLDANANIPEAYQYFDIDPFEIHGWIFVEGLALSLLAYGAYIIFYLKKTEIQRWNNHLIWKYLLSSILILDGVLLLLAEGGLIEDFYIYDPILPEFMTRVFSSVTLYIISIFLLFNTKVLEPEKKYQNSVLSPKLRKSMLQKIIHAFESDQIFTSPNHSLSFLSQHTGISENHISEVLNMENGKTFYELTNKYRIGLATQLLDSNKKLPSMEELAKSLGYKSKSTFYNAFKKEHDMTPLEFTKKNK